MKKKKRNPAATQKDYSKFYGNFAGQTVAQDTTFEFYGLMKKDGRVKIDIKRMKKVKTSGVPDEVLDVASQIPRNTTYFTPVKVHRHDYVSNRFRDALATLRKKWNENRIAFEKIKTPDS